MNFIKEEVKKILIIKFGGVGDVLLSTAIIKNLKDYFTNPKIYFLTSPSTSDVVDGNPNLERVLTFDLKNDKSYCLIKTIRKQKYDLIIDLCTNPRTNLVNFFSGAKYRMGFDFPFRNFGYNIKIPARDKGGEYHNLDFNLLALDYIGIPITSREQNIYLEKIHTDYADKFIKENNIDNKKIIGIPISGGWETKKYKVNDYISLLEMINKEYDINFLLMWGTQSEKAECEKINSKIKNSFIIPPSGLKYLAAFLKRCDIVISNDSGPMHIASAVKVPVLGIFGPTDPKIQGPYGENNLTITNDTLECLRCQLLECKIGNICMTELSKEKIILKMKELIKINNLNL